MIIIPAETPGNTPVSRLFNGEREKNNFTINRNLQCVGKLHPVWFVLDGFDAKP